MLHLKRRNLTNVMQPNATRVMQGFGLIDKLYEAGLTERNGYDVLRWEDGRVISTHPDADYHKSEFGNASQ